MTRLPGVQFTIRRLMVIVAVVGVSIGVALEAKRIWRRWRFCQERAAIFDECASNNRRDWKRESARLARTEAFIRRHEHLGAMPQRVSWLIASSGDTNQDRFCSRLFGRYLRGAQRDRELLDKINDLNQALHQLGTDRFLSPTDVADSVDSCLVGGLRDSVRRRAGWAREYDLMARAYWRAATRPWEPLPREMIRP